MKPGKLFFKTKARRTVIDGINFPSKLEADVYAELKMLELAGEIVDLRLQHRVDPNPCPTCKNRPDSVKVDFSAFHRKEGELIFHEAKGISVDRWIHFREWWRHNGPARLRIYNSGKRGPRMVEEIIPQKQGE